MRLVKKRTGKSPIIYVCNKVIRYQPKSDNKSPKKCSCSLLHYRSRCERWTVSFCSTFLTFWLMSEDDRCFPSSFLDCKHMHIMIVDEIVEAAMFKRTKNSNSWPLAWFHGSFTLLLYGVLPPTFIMRSWCYSLWLPSCIIIRLLFMVWSVLHVLWCYLRWYTYLSMINYMYLCNRTFFNMLSVARVIMVVISRDTRQSGCGILNKNVHGVNNHKIIFPWYTMYMEYIHEFTLNRAQNKFTDDTQDNYILL